MSKKADNKLNIEITEQHAENVAWLFGLTKAFSSPLRLALIGILAAKPQAVFLMADLAESLTLRPEQIEKDLRQLAEAGIIEIKEEAIPPGKREPQIRAVSFNQTYTGKMPAAIATLNHINNQVAPKEYKPLDEREKFLQTFFKDKKLVAFPAQPKRQLWAIEEISRVFEPERTYTEKAVDEILKNIFEEDHCTLRRCLVDWGFLARENGIYRKVLK
jgi:hypothetical protein